MKKVLVAGATGYLGRYVVKELKRQGFYIRVLVRHPDKWHQTEDSLMPSIREDVDEVVTADLTKPSTLKHICDNMDYVFSSVGLTKTSNGLSFKEVDYQGNINLLKEAEYSHVSRFMYIHVYLDEKWKTPGPLIQAKQRFVRALKASAIDHIIIRPTGYFSDLSPFLTMAKKGRVYLIGNGKAKMNPIHGEDLAQYCIQAFSEINQTLDVGGPETFTYEQISQLAFAVLNQKENSIHIPIPLLHAVSLGLKLFSEHYYGILRFFMNVMTHNVIAPAYGKHKVEDFFNEGS